MNTSRIYYLILFVLCSSLLGFGYYLQFVEELEPCPLCIFQRIAYIAIIVISLFGLIHAPVAKWRFFYSGMILISAVIGLVIAGRQVWLQHLPTDAVPACGPGLEFMLDVFPLTEALKMIFTGSGECAEVNWTFISFSIAEWSLVCFTMIGISAVLHLLNKLPNFKKS
ncbi:MAG: disulfide bond formation protein DsbB [Gammaproteobacteria bacterium]|jgi:disulfide bond formation protein DsbB